MTTFVHDNNEFLEVIKSLNEYLLYSPKKAINLVTELYHLELNAWNRNDESYEFEQLELTDLSLPIINILNPYELLKRLRSISYQIIINDSLQKKSDPIINEMIYKIIRKFDIPSSFEKTEEYELADTW